ncbi:MAG: SEC-C metal-binding domain-containing protein, partial [Sphingomicrobium sp.]
ALDEQGLRKRVVEKLAEAYAAKKATIGAPVLEHFEKAMFLNVLDQYWREHLAAMDYLRLGIHLRGYAQKDPKQEYKREAFELFGAMIEAVKLEVTKTLTAVQIRTQEDIKPDDEAHVENVRTVHPSSGGAAAEVEPEMNGDVIVAEEPKKRPIRVAQKVGRNDPCPCGSGKKYKHCHGKLS